MSDSSPVSNGLSTTDHENGLSNGDLKNGHSYGDLKDELANGDLKKNGHAETGVLGMENVNESDTSSYKANFNTHKPGITHEEMIQAYTEWATNYDQDLCPGRYNGPEMAAEALGKLFHPARRSTLRILDVAAGTGRVGEELTKHGFKLIDALEPSAGMLEVLERRNIYSTKYKTRIGSNATVGVIPEKIYDGLVIAGGMGEGHIPVNAINEMIRLVKSGGSIVIVMREEYLSYVSEYVDTLEPLMAAYEQQGYWVELSRHIVPEYSFNKNGVIYAFEVTSDEFPPTTDI